MANYKDDDVVLIILSVIIPLVGYIQFFRKMDKESSLATAYLIAGIGGSAVALLGISIL
jgi:hypothetical protein